MEELRKYKFKIYTVDPSTRQISGVSEYKTKPVTEDRIAEIIAREIKEYPGSCYEIVSRGKLEPK